MTKEYMLKFNGKEEKHLKPGKLYFTEKVINTFGKLPRSLYNRAIA
jgi:hypothetical protein